MRFRTLLLLLPLALAACESNPVLDALKTPPPDIGKKLNGNEIGNALTGNSVQAETSPMGPFTIHFPTPEDMIGERSNQYRDGGRWTFSEDQFCGRWQNWKGTLQNCWEVYRLGSVLTLKRTDRDLQVRVNVLPGNPEDL